MEITPTGLGYALAAIVAIGIVAWAIFGGDKPSGSGGGSQPRDGSRPSKK